MGMLCLAENMVKYIGQTVTIFTSSGGISGSGFTGILAYVNADYVKIINSIGAAPSCPLKSSCLPPNFYKTYNKNTCNNNYSTNFLGSVTEIPISKITGFTHNAI